MLSRCLHRKNPPSRASRARGFTLIELLIVVVIIGILAAIAAAQFGSTKDASRNATAKTDLRNLMNAEEVYLYDNAVYTETTQAGPGADVLDENGDFLAPASVDVELSVTTVGSGYMAVGRHIATDQAWCVNTTTTSAQIVEIAPGDTC